MSEGSSSFHVVNEGKMLTWLTLSLFSTKLFLEVYFNQSSED